VFTSENVEWEFKVTSFSHFPLITSVKSKQVNAYVSDVM